MDRTIETSVALSTGERAPSRLIVLPSHPRKRDFFKVLFGNYEPLLRVFRDRHFPMDENEMFLFGAIGPSSVHPSGAEEEMTKLREMAGMPSPV
jgi:hypothetical protein